jgi:hypothetical protein
LVVGEASPNYTCFRINDNTPKNIHDIAPNVKLIYVLRDPIERLISEFKFCVFNEYTYLNDINEYIDDITNIERSLYSEHLLSYLKYFDLSQFLIVDFHRFTEYPEVVYNEICEFLNISPIDQEFNMIYNSVEEVSNDVNAEINEENMRRITDLFKADLQKLKELTGFTFSPMIQSKYH